MIEVFGEPKAGSVIILELIEGKSMDKYLKDLYGYELENEFNRLLGDLKPTSILLNNVSRVDIEEFFYEYIDIENSVKRVQITPDKKDNCYSDEEYY